MSGRLVPVRDTRLWVESEGAGDTIVFSHGLLWSTEMYRPQIRALASRFRCVAWDHRGQGRSDVPDGDEVAIETVTDDAIALLEHLDAGPVHFVGLSMGGFVGMRIASRRPDLVKSLALLETAADPEPAANIPKYGRLNVAVRWLGVQGFLADRVMPIMFARSFLDDPDRQGEVREQRRLLRANDNSIYKAVNGVIRRAACTDELGAIRCPTLVLRGTEDRAIARERSLALVDAIDGATWVEVEGAGHTSTVEQPEAVTTAILEHLERV
ncbi:MAG: alpha/beta fold hydrolase [Alphaproteobacteria bacterium]|nr:alpha/beta fold hydrolase [Alphaproteobacteria bacterium]